HTVHPLPPRPPPSPLFPYTSLFRSLGVGAAPRDHPDERHRKMKQIPAGALFVVLHLVLQLPVADRLVTDEVDLADLDVRAFLQIDRKSTRLNSSHRTISYAVFCLKK